VCHAFWCTISVCSIALLGIDTRDPSEYLLHTATKITAGASPVAPQHTQVTPRECTPTHPLGEPPGAAGDDSAVSEEEPVLVYCVPSKCSNDGYLTRECPQAPSSSFGACPPAPHSSHGGYLTGECPQAPPSSSGVCPPAPQSSHAEPSAPAAASIPDALPVPIGSSVTYGSLACDKVRTSSELTRERGQLAPSSSFGVCPQAPHSSHGSFLTEECGQLASPSPFGACPPAPHSSHGDHLTGERGQLAPSSPLEACPPAPPSSRDVACVPLACSAKLSQTSLSSSEILRGLDAVCGFIDGQCEDASAVWKEADVNLLFEELVTTSVALTH
jgi:hypothetical protein